MLEDHEVGRVLVVVAHPDDVDFGAAGAVARWTDAGAQVTYCIVTDGDAGGFDPAVPRGDIAGIRRGEQTNAAAHLGVEDLHFLGHPDGRLEAGLDLRRDIARVIREVRPRRVVTQSPLRTLEAVYRNHPDHMAAAEATCSAVYPDSRNPYAFPELLEEGLEAWTVEELWFMGSTPGYPDHFVDITETFDRKIKALLCHASQMTDPDGIDPWIRQWNRENADAGGLGADRLAERFVVMPTV